MVFITTSQDYLDELAESLDQEMLLDWGDTDGQDQGYLILRAGEAADNILVEMREEDQLMDYTVFSLDLKEVQRRGK
jgi:hypothetical protein